MGIALSEPGGIVSPLVVLDARPTAAENARAILELTQDYPVDGIVVGFPLNMDGTEGPQAKLSRTLADAITQAGGPPVYLHDERLTSHAVDAQLAGRDLTRKKKKARQDALAAAVMLRSFLDSRAAGG